MLAASTERLFTATGMGGAAAWHGSDQRTSPKGQRGLFSRLLEYCSTMIGPRLPHVSLASLRAFEVVGRHGGLSAAAGELNVSVSAISHQMRELEQSLGVPLTKRQGRGIALTAEGNALLADLGAGFERIQKGVARAVERRDRCVLTVSCLPWFASRWLIPRLADFQVLHPDTDIRMSTTTRRVDLAREGFDCAIR